MGVQHDVSTSFTTSESSPSLSSKIRFQNALERYRKPSLPNSSTSSSPELFREKTESQKLFARQREELKRRFYKSSDSNVSNGHESQSENEREYVFSDPDSNIVVSKGGPLHFKKPLVNKENEAIFYENRGRMEPMDWSVLNDTKKSDNIQRKIDVLQNENKIQWVTQNEIKDLTATKEKSIHKPEQDPGFFHVLHNTVTQKTMYKVRDHFEDSHGKSLKQNFHKLSDSSVLNSSESNSYEPQSDNGTQNHLSDLNVINFCTDGILHLIKPLVNKENEEIYYGNRGRMDPMDWSVLNNENKVESIQKNNVFRNKSKIQSMLQNKSKKVTTIREQLKNKPEADSEFLNFVANSTTSRTIYEKDPQLIEIIDTPIKQSVISSNESNLQKANETRKKEIDEYDDMFIFTKPSKHRNLDEYEDDMFNFARSSSKPNLYGDVNHTTLKEVDTVDKALLTSSYTESVSPKDQYNRIENEQIRKHNYSFDSDDLSLHATKSEIDNSTSKRVTDNYDAFKHKLKNTSSQYSPIYKDTVKTEGENLEERLSKCMNDVFLTKEMRTAHFIMSNSNAFTEETNAVEISEVRISSKPLLTALSTRYFTKSLENKVKEPKAQNEEQESDTKYEEKESDAEYEDVIEVAKKVSTVNTSDSSNTEKLTAENKSFNDSDSSNDLYLSFNNTNNDIFTNITNNEENCDKSFALDVSTNVEEAQDSFSDEDENNSPMTFYSCKYTDDTQSSCVIIEEIQEDSKNESPIVSYSKSTADDVLALYEDMVSDSEFDTVNIDKFPAYNALFGKLMQVKEAQKAIATGIVDVNDPNFDNKIQAHVKGIKQNQRAICLDKSKCAESNLSVSSNHYSSIEESFSSVAERDYEASASDTSSLLLNTKENIFANLKIDNIQLDNSVLEFYGKKQKSNKTETIPSNKTGVSKRIERMTNALNKYRNNLKAKVAEDVKKEVTKPSKRLQLLNELKKRKEQRSNN